MEQEKEGRDVEKMEKGSNEGTMEEIVEEENEGEIEEKFIWGSER